MNLVEFHDKHWWPYCQGRLRECTLAGYRSVWKNHIRDEIGPYELEDITPRLLDSWILSQPSNGIAHSAFKVARAIIRIAYKMEFIEKDPTLRVLYTPSKYHRSQETLTRDEVDELIDGFYGHPLEAWVICMATLGLRKEEACGLLWEDIDLETGAVTIDKGEQMVDGMRIVNPPKTQNGYRTVWLSGRHLDRIRRLAQPYGHVTPYNPSSTGQRYKRFCVNEGLPFVPPKNLRTTFGTLAVQEGWDVGRVAKWMGHYDPSITMENYVHARDCSVKELAHLWDERPARPVSIIDDVPGERSSKLEQLLEIGAALLMEIAANRRALT